MLRRIVLLAVVTAVLAALSAVPALAVTTPNEQSNCTGYYSVIYA